MLSAATMISLDLELVVYRKGCLHAHLNLEHGYLTWRDSWQWCNSFTRTISEEQIANIRDMLQQCNILDQLEAADAADAGEVTGIAVADAGGAEPPAHPARSWLITARGPDRLYHMNGAGQLPDCWLQLKKKIEQISRVSFYL